jgi:hypothetical protein
MANRNMAGFAPYAEGAEEGSVGVSYFAMLGIHEKRGGARRARSPA